MGCGPAGGSPRDLRAPVPLALRAAAIFLLAVGALLSTFLRARPRPAPAAGWIVVDPKGVSRHRGDGEARLVVWAERFGLTVLASESKTRGLLAITTPQQTRYVPVRVLGEGDARAAELLFARAPVLADSDAAFSPHAPDEALSAGDAARLVSEVRARDGAAIDRMLLSDPRGAPIVLEGTELRAGDRVIDLTLPLEWRAFLFLESAGTLGSVVQATWVRQAGVEVVLVAPQADGRDPLPRGARPPSLPEAAPPIEHRIAIERLFMAPLRYALARAPRASRASVPHTTVRPEASRVP